MQTILEVLRKAGGWHHGLTSRSTTRLFMELVIEATDESGPCGLPVVSVAHYGLQNGDPMRDPEMCFEFGLGGVLSQVIQNVTTTPTADFTVTSTTGPIGDEFACGATDMG